MKRIRVEDAQPGQRVARTLYFPNGTAMLAVGAALSAAAIQKLVQFGYRDIAVFEEGAGDVDCRDLVAEPARAPMAKKLGVFFQQVRDVVGRAAAIPSGADAAEITKRLGDPAVRQAIKSVRFVEAIAGPELDAFFDGIVSEKDAPMVAGAPRTEASHAVDHAIAVAARAVVMGRALGWLPRDLREICVGGLLHDIGYLVLAEESERAPAGQQGHPVAGYHLLRADTGLSLLAAHCAYQHHERHDGSGFPRKLIGPSSISGRDSTAPGTIHRYAVLMAIADRFDLLVSGFPDGWAMQDHEAIATMRSEAGRALHPEAFRVFCSLTPPYPIGTEMEVTGGELAGCTGIVTSNSAAAIDRPVVRFLRRGGQPLAQPIEVDTAKQGVNARPRGG